MSDAGTTPGLANGRGRIVFNDLCGLVGHPTPAAFTFEKTVPGGSADAYFEEHFGWEFNGQDAQMDGAFNQLLQYQVRLKTPPLPMVSSSETIRIQSNFPGMATARSDLGIGEARPITIAP